MQYKKTGALLNDIADEPMCAVSVGGQLVRRLRNTAYPPTLVELLHWIARHSLHRSAHFPYPRGFRHQSYIADAATNSTSHFGPAREVTRQRTLASPLQLK